VFSGHTRCPSSNAVQKIVVASQSVHGYVASPEAVLTEERRRCPVCPDGHRLWRHGWYQRTAILADGETLVIPVMRLLCRRTGTTVSLLPEFCLPGRQHGPAVLGVFLQELLVSGLSLVRAMRRARPDAPLGHSLPQSLLAGFQRRLPQIRAWLARRRARAPTPCRGASRWPLELRVAAGALLAIGEDAAAGFTRAGRGVHDLCGVGLA